MELIVHSAGFSQGIRKCLFLFAVLPVIGALPGCLSDSPPATTATTGSPTISPALTFNGASSATSLTSSSIEIQWQATTSSSAVGYRIYSVASNMALTLVGSVGLGVSQYVQAGLTSGNYYTYLVRIVDVNGNTDGNLNTVSAVAYGGLASVTVTTSTTATLNYSAASAASSIQIFCTTSGTYPTTPTLTASASSTSTQITGLTPGSVYTCKVELLDPLGLLESNPTTVSFKAPNLTFAGAAAATVLSSSQVQITWAAGTGSDIANYKVYQVGTDGVTLTLITTLPSSSTSYTLTGLSNTVLTYAVNAYSSAGISDGNTVHVSAFPYAGITTGATTGSTTATVTFPTASNATSIQIFCAPTGNSGTYPATANATVSSSATTATLTGLGSGRTYTCVAEPYINGVAYPNSSSTVSFQTPSQTSTLYNGVILVSAYGPAPTAPSGPTATQVTVTWQYFGTSNTTSYSYALVRTGKGNAFNTNGPACTAATTSGCTVCTVAGAGAKSCTDTNVAASPQQYDYTVVLLSSNGVGYEETPASGDTSYRVNVPIPPANMVLVQQDSVNYEQCQLQGKTSNPLNHQRCPIVGSSMVGATAYNTGSSLENLALNLPVTYYDFGYNLFVDRWTAGCNWTASANGGLCGAGATPGDCTGSTGSAPANTVGSNGQVYYDNNSANCYVKQAGTWYSLNNSSLTSTSYMAAYSVTPSSTVHVPPIVDINQSQSNIVCSSIVDPNYGAKRILRQREFVAAAAWPFLTGEPGAMTNAQIQTMQQGNGHTGGNYTCNSDTHSGIAAAAFNSNELSRNATNGPDSFTIGSVGTSQCVSRFGAQDMVGNVWQWMSDQMTCSTASHTCTGTSSTVDAGNGYSAGFDLNGFLFNGVQGPGGTGAGQTGPNYTSEWNLNAGTFGATSFNPALGLPMVGTDSGNALLVSAISAKLHSDHFFLYSDNGTASRGLFSGGNWSYGTGSGRWAALWGYSPSIASYSIGFRCALPAE